MWNAMLHLKKQHPISVRSVEWYSQSQGFTQSVTPELVALKPFGLDDTFNGKPIPTDIKNWLYIDTSTRGEPRGLLIARINIDGKYVYIIEIQRRPCKRKDVNGKTINTEESFKGLVFILNRQDKFYNWLKTVLSQIRYVKGVVHTLTKSCPGKADSFKHVPSSNDEVPCWAALNNALSKMEIAIK